MKKYWKILPIGIKFKHKEIIMMWTTGATSLECFVFWLLNVGRKFFTFFEPHQSLIWLNWWLCLLVLTQPKFKNGRPRDVGTLRCVCLEKYPPTYLPPLDNILKELFQRRVSVETFDHSDEDDEDDDEDDPDSLSLILIQASLIECHACDRRRTTEIWS